MFESQGELRGYASLFILGPEREEELKDPANPAHENSRNVVKRELGRVVGVNLCWSPEELFFRLFGTLDTCVSAVNSSFSLAVGIFSGQAT